jgi:hypothetical protein
MHVFQNEMLNFPTYSTQISLNIIHRYQLNLSAISSSSFLRHGSKFSLYQQTPVLEISALFSQISLQYFGANWYKWQCFCVRLILGSNLGRDIEYPLRLFMVIVLSSSRQMSESYLKLSQERFLPNSLHFFIN